MKEVEIVNLSQTLLSRLTAGYCESFVCRLRGLMFRRTLPPNWGLLLVGGKDSKIDSAIHMFAMQFDLAIVWINDDMRVVDVRPAFRWRSMIVPKSPARYILEISLPHLDEFKIGDEIVFNPT